jgi:hypothetical protein
MLFRDLPLRRFNPNDLVLCRAVRTFKRCGLGIGHSVRIVGRAAKEKRQIEGSDPN